MMTYSVCLNESVLFVGRDQFGECGQKTFDSRSSHFDELS
jgi:hypothetical protein